MTLQDSILGDFLLFDNVQLVTVVAINVTTDATTTTYTNVRALKRVERGNENEEYYLNHCRWHLYAGDLPLGMNPRWQIVSVSDGNWIVEQAALETLTDRWACDCRREVS